MSDSIFNQEQPTQNVPDTNSVDTLATKLFSIKNENGEPKYDSLEKALGALSASQQYIPQLKDENEQLKARLAALEADATKRETLEETIARLTANRQPQDTQTSEAPKGLDEATVLQMVQSQLTQREQQSVASQNLSVVRNALVAKYGDKAQEAVGIKARELGMTMEMLDKLAASSPQAVLTFFQASAQPSSAPLRSSVHLPEQQRQEGVKRPEKSLLRGASTTDITSFMEQIRKEVYRENGIDE